MTRAPSRTGTASPGDLAGTLLLHGTPLTPAVWDGVARELAAIVGTAPVLTPWVELTEDPVDASTGDVALAERIAAGLPAGNPLHVVGHSFGGQVAIELALARPDRVGRLTLIGTRDTPFPAFAAAAARLRSGVPADVAAVLGRWLRPVELTGRDPLVDYARRCLAEADPGRWARALESIAVFDRTARMAEVEVPVHVVAAELDQVSTVEAMTAMAGRLPRARLTVLPGAAHLSPFLSPAALARLIAGADERDS